ncbi:MAG: protein kinase [Blastocatellia bacterium]|nr:protein kinase [Blastocatellia bacterium]
MNSSRFNSDITQPDITQTTGNGQTFGHSDETVADVVPGKTVGQVRGQGDATVADMVWERPPKPVFGSGDETVADVVPGKTVGQVRGQGDETVADVVSGKTVGQAGGQGDKTVADLPVSDQPTALEPQNRQPVNVNSGSFTENETEVFPASPQSDTGFSPPDKVTKSPFPVQQWDRYEFVKLLGQGGMGQVFKAVDLRLKRTVALKFLLGDHPELVRRFHQEAQAQARIDHDNVCKVYEVGEVEGKPFIAMEFVDGPSLKEAATDLRLEEKITIFRDVALALHAAHRLGFIHRDVKPANIMLEQREDGTWRPFVMDFGLVREMGTDGATMTGTAMGTPAYMSPEQADGDHRRVDRRSDIYSLGATLYFLLAGRPPFEAETGMSLILKVLDRELDPEPVRRLNPGVPAALDRITLTCLRKDPHLRYESAKALADDLQRYLEGEPVQAADISWRYRARRLWARHRVALSLGMVALLVLLGLSGLLVQSRWQAAQQARYAYQFGREAEQIDNIMQRAYLLPLHDIRSEKALVRERLKAVQAEMVRGGKVAATAGNYVLGRGHFALGQYREARLYLELAWQQGMRNPELALALGVSLTELYNAALLEAPGGDKPAARATYLAKIEKELRTPALNYLKIAQAAPGGDSLYVEALIAFCEDRLDDSLVKAAQAFQAQPWLYEAKKLEGDILVRQSSQQAAVGQYEIAADILERAAVPYRQALEIGRSAPNLYAAEGTRLFLKQERKISQKKFDENLIPLGLAVFADALKADPDSAVALEGVAKLQYRLGEREFELGKDPRPTLEQALEAATRTIEIDPTKGDGHNIVGSTLMVIAQYEIDHDVGTPAATLNRSIAALEEGLRRLPGEEVMRGNLGNALQVTSQYVAETGGNPQPYWDRATTVYEDAHRQNPQDTLILNNFACLWISRLDYAIRSGQDPEPFFQSGLERLNQMVAINPRMTLGHINLGVLHVLKLQSMIDHEQFSPAVAAQARQSLLHAWEIEPNPDALQGLLELTLLEATQAVRTGADTAPALAEVRRWAGEMQRLYPNYVVPLKLAQAELLAARGLKGRNRPPGDSLKKARNFIEQALAGSTSDAVNWLTAAEISLCQAEWNQLSGTQLKNVLSQGIQQAEKALKCSVDHPRALAFKGAFLQLQAKTETDPQRVAQIQAEAQTVWQRAFQLNPLLKQEFRACLPQKGIAGK